jgi:hypothetical protein
MVREAGAPVLSTVEEGADATLRLIDELDGVIGHYFDVQRESRANDQAYDRDARKRVRRLSDELIQGG